MFPEFCSMKRFNLVSCESPSRLRKTNRWLLHKVYQWKAIIRAHHLIFFADRINVNAGWLALKKSPFVCCFTSYTPDSLTRFPSSKDTFAKRPQFWCMLAKERIWPRKPAELGKRARSRNFCTLSNLFKTLYDSHLPSISALQLHGRIALCQFYLSFTVLCWSPLLF